ncbi:glycosyltransferase family 4 protein [Flavobacteriaceae sp. LMIT009]
MKRLKSKNKEKEVVILYRVIQHWRAPFFELLNNDKKLKVSVWHGPDFIDSKVVSTTKPYSFFRKSLFSLKLRFRSSNGEVLMPFSPFLFFLLIYKNPDVVIVEGASNLANSIQGFIYAKLFRKRFIWWSLGKIKNRSFGKLRTKLDMLVQFIERKSDAIISYSSRGAEYFRSIGVKKENIFVAVNVVDTKKIEEKRSANIRDVYNSPFNFTLLFVGALTKEKRIDILIKAMAHLKGIENDIGLLIVGDGKNRKELERLTIELDIHNIRFLGKRIEDNYKFFNSANLFVLPGLGGLAISEAMCYHLPVLCSIGDGCEVDLVTQENGIIEEQMTPQKLAAHLRFFYENQQLLKQMGEKSYEKIKNKYNTDTYLNSIKNAIHS